MSGGPYGRGKAPERACLKLADWPEVDRRLWQAACVPTDPFEPDGGTRATYAAKSNRKVEVGYGRWLTFLASTGQLDPDVSPTARITTERVKAYVAHLQAIGNASNTILSRLQELGDFGVAVDPTFDRGHLSRVASRVRASGKPVRDKRANLVLTDELFGLGLQLMDEAAGLSTPRLRAMAYRDGLVIAFLALRPLRRRNLASLAIGSSLRRVGETWVLAIGGDDTKTGAPIDALWPEALAEHLDSYLAEHRPVLANLRSRWASSVGNALWVSSHGSPMTEMALYDAVRDRTQAAFGKAMNLHLFRDAAATTLAIIDPDHVRSASAILGHRSQATTERHYQQAQALEAHREFAKAIARRR